MRTRELLAAVLAAAGTEAVCVCSLGRTSEELYRLYPERTLFIDSMGDVCALSLGLALGAPEVPIIAFDTDGSFLMNLSVLPVLAAHLPKTPNVCLAVLDNEQYESAGGQPSRFTPLDWTHLFGAVGLHTVCVADPTDVPAELYPAKGVIVAEVHDDDPVGQASKPLDGVESSYRIETLLSRLRGMPLRRPAEKP